MGSRFFATLLATLIATLVALAAIGWLIATYAVAPPPERYINSWFEFDLAPGWACAPDGTEIICRQGEPPHKAIAVIALKMRNDQDNLNAYESHLSQPQKLKQHDGAEITSEIRYVKRRRIGAHDWVESLHANSEVAGFDTFYLATNTSALGILVTMSVNSKNVAEFSSQLNDMMASLAVHQRQ